jgi:hypothetical protein
MLGFTPAFVMPLVRAARLTGQSISEHRWIDGRPYLRRVLFVTTAPEFTAYTFAVQFTSRIIILPSGADLTFAPHAAAGS